MTDLFEVHIIELQKILRGGSVDVWIRLFNAKSRAELEQIETQNAGVLEAMEVMKAMNLGKSLRMIYEAELKLKRDRWAEDEYIRNEGKAEGRAEGLAEGILQLLREHGEIPADLHERIMEQRDLAVLSEWLIAASKSDSIESFRTAISKR